MKHILFTILILIGCNAYAQRLFFSANYGASSYRGDLQEASMNFNQARILWGIGSAIEISNRFNFSLNYNNARVSGNDKFNPKNTKRNLSFTSNIDEFSISLEYCLFNLYEYKTSPYFFIGAGVFKFNPYINVGGGSRLYLSEYDTEGQGFFENRTKYKLTEKCFPYGMGYQWAISRNARFSIFGSFHKTNTDYLDDVSKTYIDKDLLFRTKGNIAVSLAYKGDLLPNGSPYPAAGSPRGNPNDNDTYYFIGASLKLRMNVKGKSKDLGINIKKSSVECPQIY
jgi:hypothetical protein